MLCVPQVGAALGQELGPDDVQNMLRYGALSWPVWVPPECPAPVATAAAAQPAHAPPDPAAAAQHVLGWASGAGRGGRGVLTQQDFRSIVDHFRVK